MTWLRSARSWRSLYCDPHVRTYQQQTVRSGTEGCGLLVLGPPPSGLALELPQRRVPRAGLLARLAGRAGASRTRGGGRRVEVGLNLGLGRRDRPLTWGLWGRWGLNPRPADYESVGARVVPCWLSPSTMRLCRSQACHGGSRVGRDRSMPPHAGYFGRNFGRTTGRLRPWRVGATNASGSGRLRRQARPYPRRATSGSTSGIPWSSAAERRC